MSSAAAIHPNPGLAAGRWRSKEWLVLALPFLLHLGLSLWVAFSTPYPSPFDELQHGSFIRTMAERPQLFPDYSRMMVEPPPEGGPTTANYLNHPSPYYLAFAQLLDPSRTIADQLVMLRLVNVALGAVGIAIMLLWDPLESTCRHASLSIL